MRFVDIFWTHQIAHTINGVCCLYAYNFDKMKIEKRAPVWLWAISSIKWYSLYLHIVRYFFYFVWGVFFLSANRIWLAKIFTCQSTLKSTIGYCYWIFATIQNRDSLITILFLYACGQAYGFSLSNVNVTSFVLINSFQLRRPLRNCGFFFEISES